MDHLLNLWHFNLFIIIINSIYALLLLEGSGFFFSDGFRQILGAKSPGKELALLFIQAGLYFDGYVSESELTEIREGSQPGELYFVFSNFICLVTNVFLVFYTHSLILTLPHLSTMLTVWDLMSFLLSLRM